MRRSLLVVFFLAFLPTSAKATPYAQYDPVTGDIRIREISEIRSLYVRSASGSINPNVQMAPFETVPAGTRKLYMGVITSNEFSVGARGSFQFTSLTIFGAFRPGTPSSDVSYFDRYGDMGLRQGAVIAMPEPPASLLAGISLLMAAALRRRLG